jgi:peptidoglycan/LPS O-acetylase OafA/YrhL
MHTHPLSGSASTHLNMVRGVAALAVMVGHLRSLFFVSYSEVSPKNVLLGAGYLLTSLGHQAVMVFFVLSGLFISRSVLSSLRRGRWSWKRYLIDRLTRLLLVLIPSLLLCAAWDRLGMTLPSAATFYHGEIPFFGSGTIADRSSLSVMLGNSVFLQSIFVPPFGSDTPLWSLSYEFWYYVLFPILMLLTFHRASLPRQLLLLLAGALIVWMVGSHIAILFIVWLCGAAVGALHDWRTECVENGATWPRYCFRAVGVALFFPGWLWINNSTASDLVVAAGCAMGIYSLVLAPGLGGSGAYGRLAHVLASFSYSLYLTHLPLLIVMRTYLGDVPRWQPDIRHVFWGAAIASVVAAYAFGVSRVTEAQTETLRRLAIRWIAPIRVLAIRS